jgi:autotransporter-associated beta strand protein
LRQSGHRTGRRRAALVALAALGATCLPRAATSLAGDVATFGDAITANRTVTLDAPQTVGAVVFSNIGSGRYLISGANTLTLSSPAGAYIRAISSGNTQPNTLAVPLHLLSHLTVSHLAPDLVTLSGPISGNHGIEFVGTSTAILSGANSYSGRTVSGTAR